MTSALLVLLLLLAFLCAYRGFLVEPWRIEHRVITLDLPHLPPGLARARIFFITDLHMAGWGWRELFISETLRRNPPDLIFCTGDLLSSPAGITPVLELLGDLRPPMGIYFVRGNNEVEELDDSSRFIETLQQRGWTILHNRHVRVSDPGGGWLIAGVDDPNNELDSLDDALRDAPADTFTILLSHTPETFPDASRRGIALTLSGHTHGGQVQAPWFGPLWGDTPRTGRRYVAGVFREGASTLVVSRGIGWSLLPLRFLCTPELIELRLRQA